MFNSKELTTPFKIMCLTTAALLITACSGESAKEAIGNAADKAGETAASVKDTTAGAADAMADKASGAADAMADKADAMADKAAGAADAMADKADAMADKAAGAADAMADKAAGAKDAMADKAAGAKDAMAAKVGNLAAGTFSGRSDHITTGGVSIVKKDGGYVIMLAPNFSLDGAPDPVVALGNNGVYSAANKVAVLKNKTGAQSYPIPASLNPADFTEAYIWCEKFNVPLGIATLKSTSYGS